MRDTHTTHEDQVCGGRFVPIVYRGLPAPRPPIFVAECNPLPKGSGQGCPVGMVESALTETGRAVPLHQPQRTTLENGQAHRCPGADGSPRG